MRKIGTSARKPEGELYRIRVGALRPGDVVLSKGETARSAVIRFFTGRLFKPAQCSHSAIYLGDGQVLEADSNGVHLSSLRLWLFGTSESVQVCRVVPPPESATWEGSLATVVLEARKLYLRGYNLWGAIGWPVASLLGRNVLSQADRYFCSQVVASAFHAIGVHFSGKGPASVSPQDILESEGVDRLPREDVLEPVPESFLATFGSRTAHDKTAAVFVNIQQSWATFLDLLREIPPDKRDAAALDDAVLRSGLLIDPCIRAEEVAKGLRFLGNLDGMIESGKLDIPYAEHVRRELRQVLENLQNREKEAAEFLVNLRDIVGQSPLFEEYERNCNSLRSLMISEIQEALGVLDGHLTGS